MTGRETALGGVRVRVNCVQNTFTSLPFINHQITFLSREHE
jgi:hypothetical protein